MDMRLPVGNDGFSKLRFGATLQPMPNRTNGANADDREDQGRILRLLSCIAFIVEESERLGCPLTAIEGRRAGLQLCYEADTGNEMALAFADGIRGRA